ncbi:MAG: nucleotidyltransferase domain-containing protein [Nanoarchaeota archaeon]|nr:nucleotidyltransferase domain-containing protein [Nanoarchaeota archaeon]
MVNNITVLSVLEPLLFKQEWMHLAEISRELKMPHPTARIYLNNFEKDGIVVKQIKGKLTLYKLNYSNPIVIDYITLVEKYKLIKKCAKDLLLKEIVSFLHKLDNPSIIFGSASTNLKNAEDIDVVIVGKFNSQYFKEFEKKHDLYFHLITLNKLENITPALKEEIKKKHLIVQNSEEVIKWMLKN